MPSIRHTRVRCVLAAAAWSVLATTGCAPKSDYGDFKSFVQAHNHDVVANSYRVKAPDTIGIYSPTCPEVDGVTQQITGDGTINLRLLGPVKVSTLTDKEIAAKLEKLLTRYYVDPEVEVRVLGYASRKIYVFGQVGGIGARKFTGRDTLLEVMADARPSAIAWKSRVKVVRPSAFPDEIHEITVDVDKMITQGDLRYNLLLQEGDIVWVPPTPLGWVGLKLQELLFPFSPIMNAYTWPLGVANTASAYNNYDFESAGGGYGYGGYGRSGGYGAGGYGGGGW